MVVGNLFGIISKTKSDRRRICGTTSFIRSENDRSLWRQGPLCEIR
jgi:hypothetical protein